MLPGGAAGAPGGEADGAAPGTGGRGSGRRAKKRVSFKQGDGAAEVLDGAGGSRSAGATLESALEGGEAFSWAVRTSYIPWCPVCTPGELLRKTVAQGASCAYCGKTDVRSHADLSVPPSATREPLAIHQHAGVFV